MYAPHWKAKVGYIWKAARGNVLSSCFLFYFVSSGVSPADFLFFFFQTNATEILRQRELGFSFVRLLPKETGVRPIVNLRRKPNVIPNMMTASWIICTNLYFFLFFLPFSRVLVDRSIKSFKLHLISSIMKRCVSNTSWKILNNLLSYRRFFSRNPNRTWPACPFGVLMRFTHGFSTSSRK